MRYWSSQHLRACCKKTVEEYEEYSVPLYMDIYVRTYLKTVGGLVYQLYKARLRGDQKK